MKQRVEKLPRPRYAKGKTPEGTLKSAIVKHLRLMGWLPENCWQGPMQTGKDPETSSAAKGRPDLQANKKGITIRVETKKPEHTGENGRHYQKGTLSDEQKNYIRVLRKYGILTIVTWDLDSFCRDLEEIEERFWPGECSKRLIGG